MFFYFGYGSNLSVISLRAKGVNALRSIPATLESWQLRFNVPDFFRIEGGTGNIQPCEGSVVHGVLHDCRDSELEALDRLEALGYTYQRLELSVTTYDGQRKLAYAYVGLERILDNNLLPSERYRNILVRGAVDMKLDPRYIERLRSTPTLVPPNHGPFEPGRASGTSIITDIYTPGDLALHRHLTALAGVVFDLTGARSEHAYLKELFGGKDVTLLFLRRMDTSDGTETFDDIRFDRLSEVQRRYLNAYLHEFAREYRVAGHMNYDVSPPSGGFVAVGAPVSLRWAGRRPSQMAAPRPSSTPRPVRVASRDVLRRADVMHQQLGHENTGFLSAAHGFLPRERPRLALPRDYAAWDQAAASLPDMYRSLRLRSAFDSMPLLDGSTDDLPDEDLLRAAAVLAILSHAYWYVETKPPAALPVALSAPWAQVRARLGRSQAVLTYIDLIVYNWRLLDPARRDPMRIDNMRLLIPTVDTNEERTFYLTQTEILAQAGPVIEAVVRAQEAVTADDRESLESQLLTILGCLESIRESLLSINPNPRSLTYVDPVIWAKAVAPFAVPMQDGLQGPSGTSSPIINLLDLFLGRKKFETFLGKEIAQLRQTYPRLWRDFLTAVGEVSVSKYIEESGDPNLSGLFHETLAVYAGQNGFLGRHRMKVYGYIEIAFKVGRSVTIGGFKGVFKDRTWQRVDNELEIARNEREQIFTQSCHLVRVVSVTPSDPRSDVPALEVVLDVSGTGLVFEPGDRCGILPESDDELIDRTLAVLGALGDEEVTLTEEWSRAIRLRSRFRGGATTLPLRDILRYGVLRPVIPRSAEALYELTQSELIKGYLQQGILHRFELWDLLLALQSSGFALEPLWQPDGSGSPSAICRIVPPETFRMYSIASTMSSAETGAEQQIRLSVGRLVYASETAGGGPPILRRGTASSFFARAGKRDEPVSLILHHPPRFGLPRQAQTPIVMIAGGTGLSPFRGFIAERLRQPAAGPAWLVLALRSREHFVYREELAPAVRSGLLKLDLAFSRDDIDLRWGPDRDGRWGFVEIPGHRRRAAELMLEEETARPLWEMLTSVEQGACVYVCGRSRFARSVLDAIEAILRRFATGSDEERDAGAREILCKVVAEGRLMFEIYSGHTEDDVLPGVDISQLALHNDDEHGHWAAIDGKVYDLTEYVRLHPGGMRILQSYAGMDASEGYARSHAHRSEVDAIREMYVCGRLRRLHFAEHERVIDGPEGPKVVSLAGAHRAWTAFLFLIVEMQNALRSDQALQDGITAWGDPVRPRSPYKLQRAAETHERFLRNYLDLLLGDSLPSVWAISHGLFDFPAEPTWMRKQLAEVQNSYGALYTEAILKELYLSVQSTGTPSKELDERATLAVTCEVLEEQAARLLEDLKSFVVAGIKVFEGLNGKVPSPEDERLLVACVAIPDRIQAYYDDVAARLHFMGWGSPISEQLAAAR